MKEKGEEQFIWVCAIETLDPDSSSVELTIAPNVLSLPAGA